VSIIDLTRVNPDRWEAFSFPDGQPHLSVSVFRRAEEHRLYARIASSDDLMRVLLARDALGPGAEVHLIISYLMGARMDRAMPSEGWKRHPFTLKVLVDVLKTAEWASISVFDPHSDVALALLGAQAILPVRHVTIAIEDYPEPPLIVIPDAGAQKRTNAILDKINIKVDTVQALKHRDESTGKLTDVQLFQPEKVKGRECLIVDDLCDGGRTFVNLARCLNDAGASSTALYVTHGVFSNGTPLEGIDHVFTTNSYRDLAPSGDYTVFDWRI
jgi:ribose-phosphate pyrophosphokinase